MMTPFMQARLWWRRGSAAERMSVSVAALVVLALIVWVATPTGTNGDTDVAAGTAGASGQASEGTPGAGNATTGTVGGAAAGDRGGAAAGGTSAAALSTGGSAPGSAGGGGARGASAGAGGAATGSDGSGGDARSAAGGANTNCLKPPSGTPGVSDSQITIGIGVLDLAGAIGNSAAGVASADELQRIAAAAVADINTRGGVQCRSLVAKYYKGNPINQDQLRATCLQIIQDRPFLFADAGAFAYPFGAYNCLSQQKVPVLTPTNITSSDVQRFGPYVASYTSNAETAMYTAVFGAKQMGMFDPAKGFKKLGLLLEDCAPEFNRAMEAALTKAGVTGGQISKYEFPCPSGGFASPSQMSQAVIQHRRDGVTHVFMLTGGGSQKSYTEAATTQGFRPKQIFSDYNGMMVTAGSATGPRGDTIDGALGITTNLFGLDTTPGLQPDAGTRRCQAIIAKAGLPPSYVFGKQGGTVCDAVWAAEAAINGAKALTREAALPGLFDAGPIQYSYPNPPATYAAPSKFSGGDTWWPTEFHADCNCWRVLDANRRPSFTP
jgi:hypothetical protein